MSRCFPFPPPGYEARPRSEEERHKDFLRKEKHKDKKHRKAKDRRRGETKEKGRDHRKDKHNRKHKKAKCEERKKNKDIHKDRNQTLRHRKPKENGQHESVKDIIPPDELDTRFFGQRDHTDHKYNYAELLPWSTDSIGSGCTLSKETERNLLGRMIKKSVQGTKDSYEMVQKSDSIAHASKEGMGKGIDSEAKIKNGKSLQDRSAEMHSRRMYNCKGVCHDNSGTQRSSEGVHTATGRVTPNTNTFQRTEETGQDPNISIHSANVKNDRSSTKGTGEENQCANNFQHKMDRQFARDKDGAVQGKAKGTYRKGLEGKDRDRVVKKRKTECKNKGKEVETNGSFKQKHEDLGALGASKDKVNLVHLSCLNEQKFTSDIRKMEDFYPNSSPYGQHECQHSYNNAITGSHYSEEQMPSVTSSGYESNKGYLKQHHPDTKYLSQVHCIPSTQDFSEYIDQDWLFSVDHVRRKTVTPEAVEPRQVWSDAQLIDTADVIAMPYVVPL